MPPTLITGARGFAGGHLVDRLIGREPIVAWHRPIGASPARRDGVTWQAVDLLDKSTVRRTLADVRPSRVYHVAGAPRLDTSWSNVVPHLETNVLGTHHLLDAIRELGLNCRVLVVTSAMVYKIGDEPIAEDAPLVPASPYGVSKLAQDELALRVCQDDGIDVVIARPFNHVGPRQDPHFSVPSFARQIALIESGRAEPAIRTGNLDARRDLTDVRDVVDAYERLMTTGTRGRAYNVCSGQAVRIGDVLDDLIRLSHATVRVERDPERLRPSDAPLVVGNPARLQAELGWRPRYDLATTLRDTLDWWRQQVQLSFV